MKPRLLWIPHAPWPKLSGQRQYHLVRRLTNLFEIHVITWTQPKDKQLLAVGSSCVREDPDISDVRLHEVILAPNVYRILRPEYPPDWALALNQWLFRKHIAKVIRMHEFQVGLFSSSHHFTGYPLLNCGFPYVFDYLDLSPLSVEAQYCAGASAIISISPALAQRAKRYGHPVAIIPNGVDIERYTRADGQALRARLGLKGRVIISLIGLTASPTLYFIDAIAQIKDKWNPVFLAVGDGPLRSAIERRCADLGVEAVLPGWVDPREIPEYFAATDLGLYPGDDTPYFHAAVPLKILEYTAAGKPVVSNRVDMCKEFGLHNVTMVPATKNTFAEAMNRALRCNRWREVSIERFDWDYLAEQTATLLYEVMSK